MQKIKELDVRPLIPIKRHEKLLSLFKDLPAGESFVFINDHDPKALYYEFRSISGDVDGWDYLQRDPAEWKGKQTRREASQGREREGATTVVERRRAEETDQKHADWM